MLEKRSRRTWTDEQLTLAVREARSWRGVLRNLGLHASGSAEVVQREARRLGLDTSHFGAVLRCERDEFASLLTSAVSWPQLLTSLGLRSESRRAKNAVNALAAQFGLSTDHLGRPRRERRQHDPTAHDLLPDLVHLREAAEPLAVAWLLLRGLWPALPVERRPYDFLIETPRSVKRVQVKTTTSRASSGSWFVHIARHAGGGHKHNKKVPYAVSEIDLFAIIDGDLTLYLIPIDAVAGRTGICLQPYRIFVVGGAASLSRPGHDVLASGAEPFFRLTSSPPASAPPQARAARTVTEVPAPEAEPVRDGPPTPMAARWSEQELRLAAREATSWADMLRAFGYKPSSTKPRRALQSAVRYFGIDTGHFAGKRTWSDQALIEAAPLARNWAELATALDLSPGSRRYESIRTAARRLGVSLGHLTLGPKTGRAAVGMDIPGRPRLDRLSCAAPSIAAAWFLLCGLAVSWATEPEPYDLVVQWHGKLTRVQVKSTYFRDRRGSWVVRVGHRPDGSSATADFVGYDARDVDLFFVVDGELLLYLLPVEAVAGASALSLRNYQQFVVGDASSLLESRDPTAAAGVPPGAAA